jgi:hypothetical protein
VRPFKGSPSLDFGCVTQRGRGDMRRADFLTLSAEIIIVVDVLFGSNHHREET